MKKLFSTVSMAMVLVLLFSVAFAEEGVVLKRGDISVTVNDIERYIVSNTPEASRSEILAKKGIFREIGENIYIIRTLAQQAKQDESLDWQQINWDINFQGQRRLMQAQVNKDRNSSFDNADWDAIAQEVYLVDGAKFIQPEQVHVSHVLIQFGSGRTDAEALAIAIELRLRALNGDDFAMLAKEYSDDPSAQKNSGDMGFFARGQMVKPFEDRAFSMTQAGEISEPVKSEFGYHIIQFHEYKPAMKKPFDEVKEQIIIEKSKKLAGQAQQDKMIALRSAEDLDVNTELLQQLQQQYRAPSINK